MSEQFTTMQDWTGKFVRAVGLSHAAKSVGWAMSQHATYETGLDIRPSTKQIAYETGIDGARIRGVKGHISCLVSSGWLVLVRQSSYARPAVYALGVGEYRPEFVPYDAEL